MENVELFPLWQGGQLNKSYIKGHIAVFASLTIKEFHLEAASSLASVPVEVKIWRFITRRKENWQIYSKKGKEICINVLVWEVKL